MVILRATSILGGQKEDKEMICSITLDLNLEVLLSKIKSLGFTYILNKSSYFSVKNKSLLSIMYVSLDTSASKLP
jgi:hypothetical protein